MACKYRVKDPSTGKTKLYTEQQFRKYLSDKVLKQDIEKIKSGMTARKSQYDKNIDATARTISEVAPHIPFNQIRDFAIVIENMVAGFAKTYDISEEYARANLVSTYSSQLSQTKNTLFQKQNVAIGERPVDKLSDAEEQEAKLDINPQRMSQVNHILDKLSSLGMTPLVVGDAVRDALLGRQSKYVAFQFHGVSSDALQTELAKYGKVEASDAKPGTIKFTPYEKGTKTPVRDGSFEVTVAPTADIKARTDVKGSIKNATGDVMFSIDGVAYNPITGMLYNYHGGIQDMKSMTARHVSPDFKKNAANIAAALKMQSNMGYKVHESTYKAISEMVSDGMITQGAATELMTALTEWTRAGGNPLLAYDFISDSGLGEKFFPGMMRIKNMPPNVEYNPNGNNEGHVMRIVNKALSGKKAAELSPSERALLAFASLYHDASKPRKGGDNYPKKPRKKGQALEGISGEDMLTEIFQNMGIGLDVTKKIIEALKESIPGGKITGIVDPKNNATPVLLRLAGMINIAGIGTTANVMQQDMNGVTTDMPEVVNAMNEAVSLYEDALGISLAEPALLTREDIASIGIVGNEAIGQVFRAAVNLQKAGEIKTKAEAMDWAISVAVNNPSIVSADATITVDGALVPTNIRDMFEVNQAVFGLNRTEAMASAILMDRMIGQMAIRDGISKEDMYKRLSFEKSSMDALMNLANSMRAIPQEGEDTTAADNRIQSQKEELRSKGFDIPDIDGEEFNIGENQLPNLPKNMRGAVAQAVSTIGRNAAKRLGITYEEYLQRNKSIRGSIIDNNDAISQFYNAFRSLNAMDMNESDMRILNQPNNELANVFEKNPKIAALPLDKNKLEHKWMAKFLTTSELGKQLLAELSTKKDITVADIESIINREINKIEQEAKFGEKYYITQFTEEQADRNIAKGQAAANSAIIMEFEEAKRNLPEYIRKRQDAQRTALVSQVEYLKNATEYPLAMRLDLLNNITSFEFSYDTNTGKLKKKPRTESTLSMHEPLISFFVAKTINTSAVSGTNIIDDYFYAHNTHVGAKINVEEYKNNIHKTTANGTWYKFTEENQDHQRFHNMSALSSMYPGAWCTGGDQKTADSYLEQGDLYIFYSNDANNPTLQLHIIDGEAVEIGGLLDGQGVRPQDFNDFNAFKTDNPDITFDELENYMAYSNALLRLAKVGDDLSKINAEDKRAIFDGKKYYKDRTTRLRDIKYKFTKKDIAEAYGYEENQVLSSQGDLIDAMSSGDINLNGPYFISESMDFYTWDKNWVLPNNLTVNGYLDLKVTEIKNLPDNLTVKGYLNLARTKIEKLPNNLIVEDYLELRNTPIKELSDNLTVGGSLNLSDTPIQQLPNNLTVGGNLDLSGTQIQQLPDNLTVGGSLDLADTQIQRLGNNLIVGGTLDISGTPIQQLPDNLTVRGNLNLKNTLIKELPNNLTVGGSLDLSDTPIQQLPDNLTVGGDLKLYRTSIQQLPNNLNIGGSLDLKNTPIQQLGDNLTVGGYLNLSGTPIQKLPDNLTVKGYLHLYGTEIQQLPNNLIVGGTLDISGTPIQQLPNNLIVGGTLDISGTPIQQLPDNLTVGGTLELYDTQIQQLGDNLTVGGNLNLIGTQIQQLPDNLTVGGTLNLEDTPIQQLPDNLTVGGSLNLYRTSIQQLPDNLTVGGIIYGDEKLVQEYKDRIAAGQVLAQGENAVIVKAQGRNLTIFAEDANITTIFHEKAHEYEDVLTTQEIDVLEKWSGHKFGTTEFSEAFARGAERYVYEGHLANNKTAVGKAFAKFKKWFKTEIEDAIAYFKGVPALNEDVKTIYANMLLEEKAATLPAPIQKAPSTSTLQEMPVEARGAMMAMEDGRAAIYALTNPNVSTPLHELAHVFEHYLTDNERVAVLKWAGTGAWDRSTSEKFARGFEKYLAEGSSPSSELNIIFDRFKNWLTDIYNGIKSSSIDIELNDEMRAIYASMLGVDTFGIDLKVSEGKGKYSPLDGAPTFKDATGPDPNLVDVAEKYARENGIAFARQGEYVKINEDMSNRIAAAFEEMKHDPTNPKVKEAYADLIRQTRAQYDALVKAGYVFTFFDSNTDPYNGNPVDAMRDLRQNKKMAVYGTYDGYGTEGITATELENNPMLQDTGLQWKDQNGVMHNVTANDLFRAVHDAFGHGLEGAGFRARGEENAWQAHVLLFNGPAVAAMTTETRGQNSWLNYGPYGETNRTAKLEDTVFAENKIGLMPEWTWTEGKAAPMPPVMKPATGQVLLQKPDASSIKNIAKALSKVDDKSIEAIEGYLPNVAKAPTNKTTAYKLFTVKKGSPGQLFPLFVRAKESVPIGIWVKAKAGETVVGPDGKIMVKSEIGKLAYRPGWHSGDIPIATHIGSKAAKGDKKPSLRANNQVWAEVEVASDIDWQPEAYKRATVNKKGKINLRTAEIRDQIPVGGFYKYKTNSNMTGSWMISGEMRVVRLLSDKEVEEINRRENTSDLPRTDAFDYNAYGFDASGNALNQKYSKAAYISEEYHKAKMDGTSPELVNAVESLLAPQNVEPTSGQMLLFQAEEAGMQKPKLPRFSIVLPEKSDRRSIGGVPADTQEIANMEALFNIVASNQANVPSQPLQIASTVINNVKLAPINVPTDNSRAENELMNLLRVNISMLQQGQIDSNGNFNSSVAIGMSDILTTGMVGNQRYKGGLGYPFESLHALFTGMQRDDKGNYVPIGPDYKYYAWAGVKEAPSRDMISAAKNSMKISGKELKERYRQAIMAMAGYTDAQKADMYKRVEKNIPDNKVFGTAIIFNMDSGINSNEAFARELFEQVNAISNEEQRNAVIKAIVDKTNAKKRIGAVSSLDDILAKGYRGNVPLDIRRQIIEDIFDLTTVSKTSSAALESAGITYEKVADAIREPMMKDVPPGSPMIMLAIDIDNDAVEDGARHENYPYAVLGYPIGVFEQTTPMTHLSDSALSVFLTNTYAREVKNSNVPGKQYFITVTVDNGKETWALNEKILNKKGEGFGTVIATSDNYNDILSAADKVSTNKKAVVSNMLVKSTKEAMNSFMVSMQRKPSREVNAIMNKKPIEVLLEALNISFGSNNIVSMNAEAFDQKLRSMTNANITKLASDGKIYGFVSDGIIYLNPKATNTNVAIHEYGHIWNLIAKNSRPEIYSKGVELVKDSPYMNAVLESKEYRGLIESMFGKDVITTDENKKYILNKNSSNYAAALDYAADEALATAIGDKGEKLVNIAQQRTFKQWFRQLFDAMLNAMGFDTMTADEFANITLDNFTTAVFKEMMSLQDITAGIGIPIDDRTSFSIMDINEATIAKNVAEDVARVKAAPLSEGPGATFNMDGSIYTGKGLILPVKSKNVGPKTMTGDNVGSFAKGNRKYVANDNMKLGIFKFPGENKFSIDLNIVSRPTNRELVLEIGYRLGQHSLYDTESMSLVLTGADGKTPINPTAAQVKEIQLALEQNVMPLFLNEVPGSERFKSIANQTTSEIVAAASLQGPAALDNTGQIIEDAPAAQITNNDAKNEKIKKEVVAFKDTDFISSDSMINIIQSVNGTTNVSDSTFYLGHVMRHIQGARVRLKAGKTTVSDLAKGYLMAIASINSGAISVDSFYSKSGVGSIPDMFLDEGNIRPEGAMSYYLTTDKGKRLLKNVRAGKVDAQDKSDMSKYMSPFGVFSSDKGKLGWIFGDPIKRDNKGNITERSINLTNITDFADMLKSGVPDEEAFMKMVQTMNGISFGKVGFVSHFIGIGTRGVIDTREIKGWITGKAGVALTDDQKKIANQILKLEKDGTLNTFQEAILKRMREVGDTFGVDSNISEYIGHHLIWDAVAGERNLHKGLYLAMSVNKAQFDRRKREYDAILQASETELVRDPSGASSMAYRLNQAFPNIEVKTFTDWRSELGYDPNTDEKDSTPYLTDIKGTVYGFVKDGVVYLNSNEMNPNTAMHEYAHVFMQIMKTEFPDMHSMLIQRIKADEQLMQRMRNMPNYMDLDDDAIADEVIADLVGLKGATILDSRKESHRNIMDMIKDFWNKVLNMFSKKNISMSNWSEADFKNATIEDIVNNISSDMLSGRVISRISSAEIAQESQLNNDIQNIFDALGQQVPVLKGINVTAPRFHAPQSTREEKLNKLKKTFGERTARAIYNNMGNAFDNHIALIDFIKENIPVASARLDVIEKYGKLLEKKFRKSGPKAVVESDKTPFEILSDLGYTLTEQKDADQILSYTTYYSGGNDRIGGSIICTMRDPQKRLDKGPVFFTVSEDAAVTVRASELTQDNMSEGWKNYLERIGRKNEDGTYNLAGLGNNREDPFGTSVLSIQFPVESAKEGILIISRYNHDVNQGPSNPDYTFEGDLDSMADGLEDSFFKYMGISRDVFAIRDIEYPFIYNEEEKIFKVSSSLFIETNDTDADIIRYGDGFYIRNKKGAEASSAKTTILDNNTEKILNGVIFRKDGTFENFDKDSTNGSNYGFNTPFGQNATKWEFMPNNGIKFTLESGGEVEVIIKDGRVYDIAKISDNLVRDYWGDRLTINEDGSYTVDNIGYNDNDYLFFSDKITASNGDAILERFSNTKNLRYVGRDVRVKSAFSKLTTLGNIETIGGDLDVYDGSIKSLGKLKTVNGAVDLRHSQIEDLGDLETVGKNFHVSYTQELKSLGKLKTIGGDATISASAVQDLGDLNYVGGDFFFTGRTIESLGKLKTIDGFAYFDGSNIKTLGALTSIGGSAYFKGATIGSLGELVSIGGAAAFNDAKIDSLNKLEYIGYDNYNDSINNAFNYSVEFTGSTISDLGALKYIGGSVNFNNTNIKSLNNVEVITGDVSGLSSAVDPNKKITSLGKLRIVGGSINFKYSAITSLGNLESVGMNLDLRYSEITSMGNVKSIGNSLILEEGSTIDISGIDVGNEIAYWQEAGGEIKGAFNPETNTTSLTGISDISTLIHEQGHGLYEAIKKLAADGNEKARQTLRDHDAFAASTEGRQFWERSREAGELWALGEYDPQNDVFKHELFARASEKYFMDGGKDMQLSNETKGAFNRFKKLMKSLYESIANSPENIKLTPEITRLFDAIYGQEKVAELSNKIVEKPELLGVTKERTMELAKMVEKGLPVQATNQADLYIIAKIIWGLSDRQAMAVSIVSARMMQGMRDQVLGDAANRINEISAGASITEQEFINTPFYTNNNKKKREQLLKDFRTGKMSSEDMDTAAAQAMDNIESEAISYNPYKTIRYTKGVGAPSAITAGGIDKTVQAQGAAQFFANRDVIIYALTDPNVTTPLHELAHVYEQYLTAEEAAKLKAFAQKTLGREPTKVEASEIFARGFERYLYNGEVTPEMKSLFQSFKEWILSIYHRLQGSPINIELNDDMKDMFGKMIGIAPSKTAAMADTVVNISESLSSRSSDVGLELDDEVFDLAGALGITTEDSNVLLQDTYPVETNPENIRRNRENLMKTIAEKLLQGKIPLHVSGDEAATVGKHVMSGVDAARAMAALGLNPDEKLQDQDWFVDGLSTFLNKETQVKPSNWLDGKYDENRKSYKGTNRQQIFNTRRDKFFENVKSKVETGVWSAGDITPQIIASNKYWADILRKHGITTNEFKKFMVSISADSDVVAKINKAFERRNIGGFFFPETEDEPLFALVNRYLTDELLDPELRAFILNGAQPKDGVSNVLASQFAKMVVEAVRMASYDMADAENNGRVNNIKRDVAYKQALNKMVSRDYIFDLLSRMKAGETSSLTGLDVLSEGNSDPVAAALNAMNVSSGVELILLSHVSQELYALGDKQGAANAINLQSDIAVQYGRALSTLRVLDGAKDGRGRPMLLRLRRAQAEVRLKAARDTAYIMNQDGTKVTKGEVIDMMYEAIMSQVPTADEISEAMSKNMETGDLFDMLSNMTTERIESAAAQSVIENFHALSSDEKASVVAEIVRKYADADTMYASRTALEGMMQRIVRDVIRDRIGNGHSIDINNDTTREAIKTQYFAVMAKLRDVLAARQDMPEEALKKFMRDVTGSSTADINSVMKADSDMAFDALMRRYKDTVDAEINAAKERAVNSMANAISRISGNAKSRVRKQTFMDSLWRATQKSISSRRQLESNRRAAISGEKVSDEAIQNSIYDNYVNAAEVMLGALERANAIGVTMSNADLMALAYSAIDIRSIDRLSRTAGYKNLTGDALLAAMELYMNDLYDFASQVGGDTADFEGSTSLADSREAVAKALKSASDDVLLTFAIQQEERAAKKAQQQAQRQAESAIKKRLREQKMIDNTIESARKFAEEVERRATQTNTQAIIEDLDKKSNPSSILNDYADTLPADDPMRDMIMNMDENVTPDDIAAIAGRIASDITDGKKRRATVMALTQRYNESRAEQRKTNSELTKLASRIRSKAGGKKTAQETNATRMARQALDRIMNNDTAFISSSDFEAVRSYINMSDMSDAEKQAILDVIDDIKNGVDVSNRQLAVEEFAKVLTEIYASKGRGRSKKDVTLSPQEQIRRQLADGSLDIKSVMEARAQIIATNSGQELGEKLAIIDEMLSAIIGRAIGKKQVKDLITDMISSNNPNAAAKEISKAVAEYFATGDMDESMSDMWSFISQIIDSTDPEIIAKVKEVFEQSFKQVWNEERAKKAADAIDATLKTNLNHAQEELVRAQKEYDDAVEARDQAMASGEGFEEAKKRVSDASKMLKRAKRDVETARKNYEAILRKAPTRTTLAQAMMDGMHLNEEFKDLLYRMFGIDTGLSMEDTKDLEMASQLISSKDPAEQRKGYALMNTILNKQFKRKSYFEAVAMNDIYKLNLLSSLGTSLNATIGGLYARTFEVGSAAFNVVYQGITSLVNQIAKIVGLRVNSDVSLSLAQSFLEGVLDTVVAIPATAKRISEILLTGKTSIATDADILSKQLIKADQTILDYVMRGRATNPMLWLTLGLGSDADVKDAMGAIANLSADERLKIGNMIDSWNEKMEDAGKGIIANLINIVNRGGKGIAMIGKGISLTAQDTRDRVAEALRNYSQMNAFAAGFSAIKDSASFLLGVGVRTVMTGAVIFNRLLQSVDIASNSLFNGFTRHMTTGMEALKMRQLYDAKKLGLRKVLDKIAQQFDETSDPGDVYNMIIADNSISDGDKKVIKDIYNTVYDNDIDKNLAMFAYLRGEHGVHWFAENMKNLFSDADAQTIINILEGKDQDGNPILDKKGNPLDKYGREQAVKSYLLGRGLTDTWLDELSNLWEKNNSYTNPVTRLIAMQVDKENQMTAPGETGIRPAGAAMMDAILDFTGDMNMTSAVEGRTGAMQRAFTRWTTKAQEKINARIAADPNFDGTNYALTLIRNLTSNIIDMSIVAASNIFLPLARLLAQSAKQTMLTFLPWQVRLTKKMDENGEYIFDPSGNPIWEDPRKNTLLYEQKWGFYMAKDWGTDNAFGRIQNFVYTNTAGAYQLRSQRRTYEKVRDPKGDMLRVTDNRDMTEAEMKFQRFRSVVVISTIAVLDQWARNAMFCEDENGNKLLKGNPNCVECQEGDCQEAAIRITGGGFTIKGGDYEPYSIQYLTDIPMLDSLGNPVLGPDGKPITRKGYKTKFRYDKYSGMYAMFSGIGEQYEQALTRERMGLPLTEWDTPGIISQTSDMVFGTIFESSGIKTFNENAYRLVKTLLGTPKAGATDEAQEITEAKDWNNTVVPLISNFMPIGGGFARDMAVKYGLPVNNSSEAGFLDPLSNKNIFINKVLPERPLAYGGDGQLVIPKNATFESKLPRYIESEYSRLKGMIDAGDTSPETYAKFEEMSQYRKDLNNNQRIRQLVGKVDAMGVMYHPSFSSLVDAFASPFQSGVSALQYIKNPSKIGQKWSDLMATRAARYKNEMLLSPETEGSNITLAQLLMNVSDNQKVQYLKDVNSYANSRAMVETIAEFLYDSGVVSEATETLQEPIIDVQEFLNTMKRASGKGLYKSDLVINLNGEQKGLSVAKGEGTPFPTYSVRNIARWCAKNGVIIDGNKVKLGKPMPAGDLQRLTSEELLPDINE